MWKSHTYTYTPSGMLPQDLQNDFVSNKKILDAVYVVGGTVAVLILATMIYSIKRCVQDICYRRRNRRSPTVAFHVNKVASPSNDDEVSRTNAYVEFNLTREPKAQVQSHTQVYSVPQTTGTCRQPIQTKRHSSGKKAAGDSAPHVSQHVITMKEGEEKLNITEDDERGSCVPTFDHPYARYEELVNKPCEWTGREMKEETCRYERAQTYQKGHTYERAQTYEKVCTYQSITTTFQPDTPTTDTQAYEKVCTYQTITTTFQPDTPTTDT